VLAAAAVAGLTDWRAALFRMSGKPKSAASAIDIFLRVRPHKGRRHYEVAEPDVLDKTGTRRIKFTVSKDLSSDVVNNHQEEYNFQFGNVFDQDALQEEIFEQVAVQAVNNVLDGYNSTVFAYGQTGSGKTFTITGGAERYNDRGLIPRALSKIFSEEGQRHDRQHQIYVSYLEIYQEVGYDLLDQSKETQKLEDLPRVVLQEDEDGNVHMRGLSANLANNEEEALNLLFIGDTNRMIAETPMNMASSRSHCIFTVTIESRGAGSDVIRRSKFNLVDLAGSERVHKTQADGQLLREAKHINLSLHYLEQCIVSLSEKRSHVPYRNSMMTAVLRDSLGGNCKTAMIATVSAEQRNMDEAISTCRFAQRVAMVKNEATINESLDPHLMIKRLKQENRELREEIAMLNGEAVDRGDSAIGDEEMARLQDLVRLYLADTSEDAKLAVSDFAKIRAVFRIMKNLVLERGARPSTGGGVASFVTSSESEQMVQSRGDAGDEPVSTGQVETLKLQLQQRDNEINILVAMLNKRGGGSGSTGASGSTLVALDSASTVTSSAVHATQHRTGVHGGGHEQLEPEPEPAATPAVNLHMLDGSDTGGEDTSLLTAGH
jgi:kinesin family member 6/9